jgi:hypothetical protein
MPKENGYNGYTNYETWAVCLWLDNEEGLYDTARRMASDTLVETADDSLKPTKGELHEAADKLAPILKDWLEEMMPEMGANVFSDLLNAAWSEVDWLEVASTRFDE